MAAKAIDVNGTIKIYSTVPKSWGNIIGEFNNLSDSELETHGFYNIEYPSDYDSQIHKLGSLTFDSDNSVFSYSKTNKEWSQSVSELKAQKISNLKSIYKSKLEKTDWVIIRDKELGNVTDQSILDARAALRTDCSDKEAEINALTTKSSIVKFSLPNLN